MKNAIVLQLKSSPREWRTIILFMMLAYIPMFGQNIMNQHGNAKTQSLSKEQIEFNERLDAFVDSYMKDQKIMDRYSQQRHTCSAHKEVDTASLVMKEARHQFIVQNLEEYKLLFMSAEQSMTVMDICDNGGFEDDFLYYEGFTSIYSFGSDSCSPHTSFGPSVFIPATLPTTDRFEIVTSGIDPLVGISRTKFGDKALRINNRYGHAITCDGDRGVDKITKTFEVTAENRIFSVWYAVVLENPSGHSDAHPFFNMKCDLAPANDLCFTADFLTCDSLYSDSLCTFDRIVVLDWVCHKFRIDTSFIGDTATLEITVADCGLTAHFGYAYIDGICEECTGSALGEIFLEYIDYNISCDSTLARICGSYIPPEFCDQDWWLDEVVINGYTVSGFDIDTATNTFCVYFPKSNFGMVSCLSVAVEGIFTNGSQSTPYQTSNEIEVCQDLYVIPSIDIMVSGCMTNTPAGGVPNNNISDDYYYVNIEIDNHDGLDWIILRTLTDPYPNEQDTRKIAQGTGNGALVLGPFKIQEGGWILTLYVEGGCELIEYIDPPAYCSGCSAFYEVEIGNVQCLEDDDWSFDLYVPSETGVTYDLIDENSNVTTYNYNVNHTIEVGAIEQGCIEFTLDDVSCASSTTFIICPPKPCSFNCNLEVHVVDVPCTKDQHGVITFYVDLDVYWPPSRYACYEVTDVDGNSLDDGPLPLNQQVGPFDEDIYLTIFVCTSSSCTNCPCFKTIYVPIPDCNQGGSRQVTGTYETVLPNNAAVSVQPNPTHSGEIIIYSSLQVTNYEILDVRGQRIVMDSFTGEKRMQTLPGPPGIYFLKYWDMNGHGTLVKIIKQ
jgi:hypothetical protein